MKNGPLAGVRLIEMDAIGPVPLCGMILSGLGADIVRITRPGGQGAWGDLGDAVVLRGRTSVPLDLKSAEGKAAVLDLVEQADGIMEGARPGVMERLGLGPAECLARNPALVYGRMTGWGQDGPLAMTAGHDINYVAMTGALHAIGDGNGPPSPPLNLLGDYAGGTLFLALGMVSAVLNARSSGTGQVVDAAMVDGVANLLGLYQAWLATGTWKDEPGTNLLDGAAPFYRCYVCKDEGYVAVGALEPQFFAKLIEKLGFEADRYVQNDPSGWPQMAADFERAFASRTRGEWEDVFEGSDACVSPVLSMREAMNHPANAQRGVFTEIGGVSQAAPAPRFSETPGGITASEEIDAQTALARWSEKLT